MEAHLNVISYEIDQKGGADLDRFVGIFGFARKGGVLATTTVQFLSSEVPVATSNFIIPTGTRVVASGTLERVAS